MDVEVAADLAAAEPGAQQQLGGAEGAAGDDHRAAGAHRVGGGGGRCAGRAAAQRHPDRAPVLDAGPGCASTPARSRAPAATARGR